MEKQSASLQWNPWDNHLILFSCKSWTLTPPLNMTPLATQSRWRRCCLRILALPLQTAALLRSPEICTSELLQDVREEHAPNIRIASRCEDKRKPPRLASQRDKWHYNKELHLNTTGLGAQQNTPIIRIASRYGGNIQSQHQNCFKMWGQKKPFHSCFSKERLIASHPTKTVTSAHNWPRDTAEHSQHQNCFKMWGENTIPTSELLQDVRKKHYPNIRIASRCEDKRKPLRLASQRDKWHYNKELHLNTTGLGAQQNSPIIRIASRYGGNIQSQHQNCFQMWEK